MMSSILFNGIAIGLIIFIVLWFWVIKEKSTRADRHELTIYVKNGAYSPSRIETSNSEIILNFVREDISPCSEYVVFESLDIHEQLPLNKSLKIHLRDLKLGHYRFTCQMGMYQGELIVR